jgi:hypothetical protein
MLSFAIDIIGAYFAAKNFRGLGSLILVSILIGVFSAVISNMLIYMVASDSFTFKEIFSRIIFGVVVHPFITTIASLIFRKTLKKKSE